MTKDTSGLKLCSQIQKTRVPHRNFCGICARFRRPTHVSHHCPGGDAMPRGHGADDGASGLWMKTSPGRRVENLRLKDVEAARGAMNRAGRPADGAEELRSRAQGARLSLLGKPLAYRAQSGRRGLRVPRVRVSGTSFQSLNPTLRRSFIHSFI